MLASFALVGFLLAIILFILGSVMAVPLLIFSGIGCYYYYGQPIGLKALYKQLTWWVLALGLELGVLCIVSCQRLLCFVGLLVMLVASIGIYETWSRLTKGLSKLSSSWFILCFVVAFLLFGIENRYGTVSAILLMSYGILGIYFSGKFKDEKTAHVRGMSFLVKGLRGREVEGGLTLGGVALPSDLETQHFLIAGRTGSGKTLAISELLRVIRQRGDRVIIADPGGGYVSRFFCEGDIILNPFDQRGVNWSPFGEIRSNYDFGRLARSVIPDAVGDAKDWHHQAQNLFAYVMRRLYEKGEWYVPELLRLLTAASVSELKPMLAGSVGEQLTHSGNEKLLSNTRGILAAYLTPWEHLANSKDAFSMRDWVSKKGSGWLFLTYRDDQLADLRFLISTWMDLAIVEGLSLEESVWRRLWYVMDELDSLGKINTLKDGLTKLRKYGGCCIAGLQTIAQLRHTYGYHEAQTLLSCMATKLILTAGDTETAEYFSRELGQREVLRREKTFSENLSKTIAERHHLEWAVLPSEISSLKVREGFLRITGTPEIAKIEVPLVKMAQVAPTFVNQHAFSE